MRSRKPMNNKDISIPWEIPRVLGASCQEPGTSSFLYNTKPHSRCSTNICYTERYTEKYQKLVGKWKAGRLSDSATWHVYSYIPVMEMDTLGYEKRLNIPVTRWTSHALVYITKDHEDNLASHVTCLRQRMPARLTWACTSTWVDFLL